MKYTLVWEAKAEIDLANIWLDASPEWKNKVQEAVDLVETVLRVRPMTSENLAATGQESKFNIRSACHSRFWKTSEKFAFSRFTSSSDVTRSVRMPSSFASDLYARWKAACHRHCPPGQGADGKY
jgi:hypothetical protein